VCGVAAVPDNPTLGLFEARLGGERAVLEAFLDFYRGVVVRKVRGVPEAEARRRLVPSSTTLAGLAKHMATAERNWFHRILGRRTVELPELSGDADGSWRLDAGDTVEALLDEYERTCATSREIAAGVDLDHAVPHEGLGEVSLRWIYVHMIEETARHAGHADIMRELTDGQTGVVG
jgi:uncharacterized damage-inducible protein DinB